MRWLLLAAFLLLPYGIAAQEQTASSSKASPEQQAVPVCGLRDSQGTETRPRIGVALEGGGALGLAHIGVLQWFEEHHVPVDCIAGTSMGGLVGGFYATGMNPTELRKLIEGIDWDELLRSGTDYEDLSFRRKEDQRAYPNSLILGLRNGISIPAGLNAGHQIGLLIDRVTLPYYAESSFDALPVPFQCVATELVTGKAYVFKNGSLAEALRSTISIPGLFSPVHDGNRVFVDGGLVNNLPTDVVRKMGADIVIAVHLERQPAEAKDIQSLFGVLQQSVRVVIAENEATGLARADAVVTVPLNEFEPSDYKKSESIMQRGYDAADERSRFLDKFAIAESEWKEFASARDTRKRTLKPVPQFVKVQGTNAARAADIERFLKPLTGQPLDTEKLDRALTRLTGVGRYDAVGYRITERNGQQGLLIAVSEKNYAPPTIQPAAEVDGSESGDVDFTLGARLTLLDVAGFRSEWRTDFLIGKTYGIQSELYKPFDASSKWFVAPYADASDTAFKVDVKNDPVANYRFYRADIGADIGYGFNRFSELRAGYEVGYLNDQLRLGTPQFPSVKGRVGAARLRYRFDHTDDPVIPRKGVRLDSNFRWFDTSPGANGGFPALDAQVSYFQPITRPASLFLVAEGGTTFGFRQTGLPQYFLGGPLRLSAYGQNELNGNQYYFFRAGYLHDLLTLPRFVGKNVYAIGSFEFGKVYGAPNSSRFPNDFAAGLLAETSLGPVFIGGSVGDSGHHKWFFQLGRVF